MKSAIILAAGLGNRLLPLTSLKPKTLVPIGNRPVLFHTLQLLKKHSIGKIAINLFHHPDLIMDWIKKEPICSNFEIEFSIEKQILGTAGGIKKASSWLAEPPFLIINGDILIDVDLDDLMEFHRRKDSIATLVLREHPSVSFFGTLKVDGHGRIRQFLEHGYPNYLQKETQLREVMFTGVQIIESEFLDHIPYGEYKDLSRDIYPKIMEKNLPIYGYIMQGYWADIGTPLRYLQANKDYLNGKLKIGSGDPIPPLPGSAGSPDPEKGNSYTIKFHPCSPSVSMAADIHHETLIKKTQTILPPVALGKNCSLGEDIIIGPEVSIGDGVILGDNLRIERSLIWENVSIGDGAKISNSLILSHTKIPANVTLDRVIVSKNRDTSLNLEHLRCGLDPGC